MLRASCQIEREKMVGLSVLLESETCPQTVIDKMALCRSPTGRSTAITTFLDVCLFCKKRLSPKDDIFMYKGDRAFCSVECRCRHIFMEEERVDREKNCALVAASANSSSSSPARSGRETTTGHRVGSFFAY